MAALGIRLRSLLKFSLVARHRSSRPRKARTAAKRVFGTSPPCGFPLPVLSGAYIRSQAYSAVAPMKAIRDPENWERTGLNRLAICGRGRRHPVWTQAGSDVQSPGSAGPGLPPLAASAGEKKKPPPDCATFSISGWCFADWFVGSCFSVAERCRQASPLSRKFTGSDAAQWLSL